MKASIIVSKILRELDTQSSFGDASSLSTAYNEAVDVLNSRMDAIVSAIDSGEVSDAIRMLDESPSVLETINALDFFRLDEWVRFCEESGILQPHSLNRQQIERVLQFNDSADIVDGALKGYRRASRIGDQKSVLECLRRLAGKDTSQDWMQKLSDGEDAYIKNLADEFVSAQEEGDEERSLEIAQEISETKWVKKPEGVEVEKVFAFLREREERRINQEKDENLELLKKCAVDKWNRSQAQSLIGAMDRLVENGLTLSFEEGEIVEGCRARCNKEIAEEEADLQWKKACEDLHVAVEHENPKEIRNALAFPGFLDREPTEELLRGAQDVLDHDAAMQKRKSVLITVGVCVVVAALVAVSGIWFQKKQFSERCDAEVAKLETLKNGAYAIEHLGSELRRVKQEEPEIYALSAVNVYEQKLESMVRDNLTRTNELASSLNELSSFYDRGWDGATEGNVTSRFVRVKELLRDEDLVFRKLYAKMRNSWNDEVKRRSDLAKERAKSEALHFQNLIVDKARKVINRFAACMATAEMKKEYQECIGSYDKWKSEHEDSALPDGVEDVIRELKEAYCRQEVFLKLVATLNDAKTGKEVVATREEIMKKYAGFNEVKKMGVYPASPRDVTMVLSRQMPRQKVIKSELSGKFSVEDFRDFLNESVGILGEFPVYTSLWGIGKKKKGFAGVSGTLFAIALGRPSNEDGEIIANIFVDMVKKEIADEIKCLETYEYDFVEMDLTEEVKEIVDASKSSNITRKKFVDLLWKWIVHHCDTYENNQLFGQKKYYPEYRRIMMINMYISWLKTMNEYPSSVYFDMFASEIEDLANAIFIEGVPDDITWLCYWENRVKKRNGDCSEFLSRHKGSFKKEFDNYKKDLEKKLDTKFRLTTALNTIRGFKVVDAGLLQFKPGNVKWLEKPQRMPFMQTFARVSTDAPLYVLRRSANGDIVLRRAFAWSKDVNASVGSWRFDKSIEVFYAGEPLFQVEMGGVRVNAHEEIAKIAQKHGIDYRELLKETIFE